MCEAQRGIYKVGMTGIPIINSNNNGATGGTALWQTWNAVRCGVVDCALTLGFDQMEPGALKEYYPDRVSPMQEFRARIDELDGKDFDKRTQVVRMFAAAGKEHSKKYGTKFETFAKIAEKNHRHASNNKNALY